MKLFLYAIATILFVAGSTASALAETLVPFSDEGAFQTIYWPGFKDPDNHYNENKLDVIGDPNLTGGNFIYDGHTLTGISLNYTTTSNVLIPADWFFDFNNDGKWDYVLHNTNTVAKNYDKEDKYLLYDVRLDNLSISTSSIYTYSSWPNGYYGRYNHPVALKSTYLTNGKTVTFSGWDPLPPVDGPAVWSGINIDLDPYSGKNFTYAFAMLCANDVLYGSSRVPTPEPGTLLLMGTGALGAAILRRRAKRSTL